MLWRRYFLIYFLTARYRFPFLVHDFYHGFYSIFYHVFAWGVKDICLDQVDGSAIFSFTVVSILFVVSHCNLLRKMIT